MSGTINFGIDLGTTNSAIAHCDQGEVRVYKNPITLKETIASVVAFKGSRVIIGEKAREMLNKNATDVIGTFKRKMGTSDSYFVEATSTTISPIELSAMILKELKNFVKDMTEDLNAAVITIPAAFDTIQSNATKKAGYQAGFKEVVLLQEPIAASLAFANKAGFDIESGKWLVYDFGGGTFDVALTAIEDGELKILDHEGDNYLGGLDIDRTIIEGFVIPKLQDIGDFSDIKLEMVKSTGKYNQLYNKLLFLAEEAKKTLTSMDLAEIEFEIVDDSGVEHDVYLELTNEIFNSLISPIVERTLVMIQSIMDRNDLSPASLKCILLIGGTTYIPLIRSMLDTRYSIEVNTSMDPTIAVAVGAGYYAGMKPKSIKAVSADVAKSNDSDNSKFNVAYERFTKDVEAMILIRCTTECDYHFRISRADGAYDSGLIKTTSMKSLKLPLLDNTVNNFAFNVTNELGNVVYHEDVTITNGKFNIEGQPLPNNICLEVDAVSDETTFLEPIFKKNDILPLKKTITKQVSKTILKSENQSIIIKVIEGDVDSIPAANKLIGFIEIKSADLTRDLVKGSDIELTFEVTESRDIKVSIYLVLSDQEFENTFSPSETNVTKELLTEEFESFKSNLQSKLKSLEREGAYESAAVVVKLNDKIDQILSEIAIIDPDQTTDEIYVLNAQKREVGKQIQNVFNQSLLTKVTNEYYRHKSNTKYMLDDVNATEADRILYKQLVDAERSILQSGNISSIKFHSVSQENVCNRISRRTPTTSEDIKVSYMFMKMSEFKDEAKAKKLIQDGDEASEANNLSKLIPIMNELHRLIKNEGEGGELFKSKSTGIK